MILEEKSKHGQRPNDTGIFSDSKILNLKILGFLLLLYYLLNLRFYPFQSSISHQICPKSGKLWKRQNSINTGSVQIIEYKLKVYFMILQTFFIKEHFLKLVLYSKDV